MRNIVLGLMAVCLLSGCAFNPKGMNSQRSGLRGLGDSAVTISLDSIKSDVDAKIVQTQVKEVAIAVQLFLKDGKVADLTLPVFTEKLRNLIPADYLFLFDLLMAQVQGITVNVDKIGANNIERLNSVCVGLINGCSLYDMQYRPVTPPVVVPEVAAVPSAPAVPAVVPADKSKAVSKPVVDPKVIKAFGARLKKESRK